VWEAEERVAAQRLDYLFSFVPTLCSGESYPGLRAQRTAEVEIDLIFLVYVPHPEGYVDYMKHLTKETVGPRRAHSQTEKGNPSLQRCAVRKARGITLLVSFVTKREL